MYSINLSDTINLSGSGFLFNLSEIIGVKLLFSLSVLLSEAIS